MKKCKISYLLFYLEYPLSLESKIKPINALIYPLSWKKNPNKNILCLVCSTDCPVLLGKGKNQRFLYLLTSSKSIDFTINCFRPLVLSEGRTRFDDMTKIRIQTNEQILHFSLCRGRGYWSLLIFYVKWQFSYEKLLDIFVFMLKTHSVYTCRF